MDPGPSGVPGQENAPNFVIRTRESKKLEPDRVAGSSCSVKERGNRHDHVPPYPAMAVTRIWGSHPMSVEPECRSQGQILVMRELYTYCSKKYLNVADSKYLDSKK